MTNGIPPQRRVHAYHDVRLDGFFDLVSRASGMSVLDLGCNRGLLGFEMACNGARLVHGLDLSEAAIKTAREMFADLHVQHQFEAGDLTRGPSCLDPFGGGNWDIVMLIGTYHKIKRAPSKSYASMGARGMNAEELSELMTHLGARTQHYLAWRGALEEIPQIDSDLARAGLRRVQLSEMSQIGPSVIYRRD